MTVNGVVKDWRRQIPLTLLAGRREKVDSHANQPNNYAMEQNVSAWDAKRGITLDKATKTVTLAHRKRSATLTITKRPCCDNRN